MLARLAMRINFLVRRNPTRRLYDERVLRGFVDPVEAPYLQRAWDGDIWDVGASVGKYTTILAAANPGRTVYAFEPNLNSLYFLAYRIRAHANVVLVPNALTVDGAPMKGTFDPDFNAPPTGPRVASLGVREALERFGCPRFVKMDIEGGEFDLIPALPPVFRQATLLVSWHPHLVNRPIPAIDGWSVTFLQEDISLLTPIG